MRTIALLIVALVVPACGGGGGSGGGSGWTLFLPPIPAAGTGGATGGGHLTPLPLDGAAVTHTIPTAGTDESVRLALQTLLDGAGTSFVVRFDNHPAARTVVLSQHVRLPAFKTLVLDGRGSLTLSGGLNNRILLKQHDTRLTVQRLTFENGRADESGGAIDFDGWEGRLTVIDCVFRNCRTREAGPDRGGGAIRAWGHKHTRISGSTFQDCHASNGGAVNSLGSQLTIIDCLFERNVAFGTAGGAEIGGGGGIGGAVYIDNVHLNGDLPEFNLSGSVFRNNVANAHAGAVFAYTTAEDTTPPDLVPVSLTRVEGCTFSGNQVTGQGGGGGHSGAFYAQNGTRSFVDSTFDGNIAAGPAGAVFINAAGDVAFTSCTFQGNQAGGLGGALFLTGGTNTLMNVTVSGNHSALFAGGISRGGGVSVTMTNSLLQNNTGTDVFNGWNVNQALSGGGNNLQWPSGGATNVAALPGIAFANANLQALSGTPTRTMGILAASPAIDAGTSTGAPTLDQRGLARQLAVDVGAFERQPGDP